MVFKGWSEESKVKGGVRIGNQRERGCSDNSKGWAISGALYIYIYSFSLFFFLFLSFFFFFFLFFRLCQVGSLILFLKHHFLKRLFRLDHQKLKFDNIFLIFF